MEDPKKKPVKGQEFLQKLGRNLIGNQNQGTSSESTAEEYEAQTKAVEAQDRYNTAVDKVKNPPSVVEMQKEQTQRLADEKKTAEERAQKLADEEHARLQQDADTAAQKALEEQQKREQAEIALQDQHNQMLLNKLDELKQSQKPFADQAKEFFAFAQEAATMLGFEKPNAVKPASEDPKIALELAKMNLELEKWKMEQEAKREQDKFDREIKLLEVKENRVIEKEKLAQQAKRDDMLFTAPQTLGAAIAQGLLGQREGAAPVDRSEPQTHKVTAGVGESGETVCPNCQAKVGIGPTTARATCVGCGDIFDVERIQQKKETSNGENR